MALETIEFNDTWRFCNDWNDAMIQADYDDSSFRKVKLPHDWSIEGNFSIDAPSYCRGGYLPTGMGCYRKEFTLPAEWDSQPVSFYFGGVFKNSEVYLNGHRIGGREWGYIPFEVSCASFLKAGEKNLVVVKVDNSDPMGCRWYAGSGIYRKVELCRHHDSLSFPRWGLQVKTPKISSEKAEALITFKVWNKSMKRLAFHIRHKLFDPQGECIADTERPHWIGSGLTVQLVDMLPIANPMLWNLDSPNLYTLETTLIYEEEIVDISCLRFGIRQIAFDAEKGFFLNGKSCKIKGVCLHNDGGALGAACGKTTFLRQLTILKSMGCNGVRTAHHPFSEEFLDACDEMGILVLAEAFDEWSEPITVAPLSNGEWQKQHANYYAQLFERCAERDLADMVLRDRNHPSIFLWSIGNEVPQMYKFSGGAIAGKLREIVWNLDGTRPVTCAIVSGCVSHANVALLDVGGYNYPNAKQMQEFHTAHMEQPMIITECYSAQTRRPLGKYFAVGKLEELDDYYEGKLNFIKQFEDMGLGRAAWEAAEKYPFVMGQFIWTGWDYMGEPTPYDYPSHSSIFGVIDLCGFPKDGYYYYRSVWRPEPLIHIASHWDFSEGDKVDIYVITNCPQAELFCNGTSMGTRGVGENFVWCIPFRSGELKAVGKTPDGKEIQDTVYTSRQPVRIELHPSELIPGRRDILYVECRITDMENRRVLNAELPIRFQVSGAGKLKALDNGSQVSGEPFQGTEVRHTCAGRCLCILEAEGEGEGEIMLRAESDGLLPAAELRL